MTVNADKSANGIQSRIELNSPHRISLLLITSVYSAASVLIVIECLY